MKKSPSPIVDRNPLISQNITPALKVNKNNNMNLMDEFQFNKKTNMDVNIFPAKDKNEHLYRPHIKRNNNLNNIKTIYINKDRSNDNINETAIAL